MKTRLSKLEKDLLSVCKRHQVTFHALGNAMKAVRGQLEGELFFQKPNRAKKLPRIPQIGELKRFFKAFDQLDCPQYKLWAYLIYDAGIRVHELVGILVNEVNFSDNTILIRGKGHDGSGKIERLVSISPEIAELLKLHVRSNPGFVWLFQNPDGAHYSVRMVQYTFQKARKIAGIEKPMNPHQGRHTLITELTKAGVASPVVQLQSGHKSEQGVANYRHLAIAHFAPQLNEVRSNFWADVRG